MSRKEVLEITDDYDGKLINPDEEWSPVPFVVNGTAYQLDLRAANQDRFYKDMDKWINKATKVGRAPKVGGSKPAKPASDTSGHNLTAIREWANNNGYTVSEKGRIPKHIMEAYEANEAANAS
ncbi:Lsr2-like DNA bridging protein [Gordonia Phage Sephiroth]|uniref:Lsr2-like DNA bridging protein n=2 Tax=Octobienvirus TaxID=3044779 RepID=A0AAE8Y643_9CAUD|nr:nucloid associated Lsr2-like [Gordonia Phage Sephiroth]YP_010246556.1 nucloid associated Lsr2-like [Gordonia phage Kudefre]QNN99382.1 Lsr2-like DNA bridging protein [Gordonia Phage Sephiroth]UDL15271.1 Lsr2-like DNA bridging protein [Gordonia phage Kudefre]